MKAAAFLLTLLMALPAFAEDHWIRITTSHFEMYTTGDESKAKETILHFERVRDFFLQVSPVKPPGEFPVRIVAFKDSEMMHVYAPNQSVRAFFAPGPVRDTIVMQNPVPDNYSVTIHEYVHLVVRHSGLKLPLWLNEGWAELYSTLRPVKDGVAVGDLIPAHMATLQRAKWFSLDELEAINTHSPEYNESARTGMFYSESWALVHMLYLSPGYKDNFRRFISALNKGMSLQDAMQSSFGKGSSQVFTDLLGYMARKNLVGTVFLTPFEKSAETPVVTPVVPFDEHLMEADLHASALHLVEANRLYHQLELEEPKRPEAFAGEGYLAIQTGDKETARRQLRMAFELGSTDPQLCMQLAALDRMAKQPITVVMAELERAVQLRPDFAEAIFELAVLKVDARDFDEALSLLGRVGTVGPDRMAIFRSARAYVNLQKGNIDLARADAEAAGRASKTPEEKQAAEKLVKLIDARSKGFAAALPGEKVVRAEGTAIGLRCAASGSDTLSKMGITIDGKQMLFDLPDAAAVELTRQPGSKTELKCGALPPFHLTVEYAPASVTNRQSAGIIRRLEF